MGKRKRERAITPGWGSCRALFTNTEMRSSRVFKVTEFQLGCLTRPLEWFSHALYHLNLVYKFF